MKRWTIRITVFLLLGAIVNVAVAWSTLALTYDTWLARASDPVLGYWPQAAPALDVYSLAAVGVHSVEFFRTTQSADELRAGRPAGARVVPSWSCVSHLGTSWVELGETYHDVAWGWPMLSMHSCVRFETVPIQQRSFAFEVAKAHGGFATPWLQDVNGRNLVPVIPIWPGFAINTVFYAAVLWGLFAVPMALGGLQKRRRIKRGWCPKCAYDLRGRAPSSTVCPECGAAVRRRERVHYELPDESVDRSEGVTA